MSWGTEGACSLADGSASGLGSGSGVRVGGVSGFEGASSGARWNGMMAGSGAD